MKTTEYNLGHTNLESYDGGEKTGWMLESGRRKWGMGKI